MTSPVRLLKEAGLSAFRDWIRALQDGDDRAPPFEALEDASCSEPLAADARVDTTLRFDDRLEFGRYLKSALEPVRAMPSMDRNVGLWSWLALAFVDQLCPPDRDGLRRPQQEYRYILAIDYRHHYRHLVRTPCLAYAVHGEFARLVLSGPLHVHGEAAEALLSREHLFTNKALFESMDRLFVRRRGGAAAVKSGARAKGGGTLRRLAKIVKQFDLTFDLTAMDADGILALLPQEFDRFRH